MSKHRTRVLVRSGCQTVNPAGGGAFSAWRLLLIPFVGFSLASCTWDQGVDEQMTDGTVVAELDLRIESPSDGTRDYFGSVADIELDNEGRLYVLDGLAGRVTAFRTADGRPLRSFGSLGEGPSDFGGSPVSLHMGPSHSLLITDMARQRLVSYSTDGTPIESISLPADEASFSKFRSSVQGHLYVRYVDVGFASIGTDEAGAHTPWIGLLDIEARPLGPKSVRRIAPVPTATERGQGNVRTFLGPTSLWAVSQDGRLIVTSTWADHLEVLSPEGSVAAAFDLSGPPLEVTERERSALTKAFQSGLESMGFSSSAASEMMEESFRIADVYPRFVALMFGPGDTVWLQKPRRVEELVEAGEAIELQGDAGIPGGAWRVYSTDGTLLRVVSFPEGFEARTHLGERIFGIHTDELGVQSVRAYVAR